MDWLVAHVMIDSSCRRGYCRHGYYLDHQTSL